ncbi:MAG: DUF542 domain-containing protein [Chitinophagaceae bacterium]|nr:DUF542 domain-containing protein [Chitinophagaceae bacterium]
MNVLASKTLAQIVTNNHKAASIFEKHHLDFCCKGKRTLEQACSESDIKIEEVLKELDKAEKTSESKTNYNELSLAQLSEHIVSTHHNYVKNEMPALLGYLQKVSSKHGDRHPEMNKVFQIFGAVKEEMEFHMQKEEMVTYQLSFASLQAFELDLHRHVHLENNILFPKALKMFGSQINISLN